MYVWFAEMLTANIIPGARRRLTLRSRRDHIWGKMLANSSEIQICLLYPNARCETQTWGGVGGDNLKISGPMCEMGFWPPWQSLGSLRGQIVATYEAKAVYLLSFFLFYCLLTGYYMIVTGPSALSVSVELLTAFLLDLTPISSILYSVVTLQR